MKRLKDELKEFIKSRPHVALSAPAILCFITFITNFIASIKDGVIDSAEYHTLLTTFDGFEAVVLFFIALALNDRDK